MRRTVTFACWGWLVWVGCGGSDGDRVTFESSLPPDAPINGLSAADATRLCTEELSFEERAFPPPTRLELACRAIGIQTASQSGQILSDAGIRSSCQAAHDECLRNPPILDDTPIFLACANAMSKTVTCGATVGDYVACTNEWSANLPRLLPPCADLDSARLLAIVSEGNGPACAKFDSFCPELGFRP